MKRFGSIDVLRGQVMILMALDHVRDFFHLGSFFRDPLNHYSTTPILFFTRWITHFCAPVFVFLAGISIFLKKEKLGSPGKTSMYLLIRGSVLIILELTIVNFGWTFELAGSFQMLQVIWAMGISMIVLAPAIFLPPIVVLMGGLLIIFFHNMIHLPSSGSGFSVLMSKFLLNGGSVLTERGGIIGFTYPVLPWIGLMFAGYGSGSLFSRGYSRKKRSRILLFSGIAMILFFILLRSLRLYGDPSNWTGNVYSFFDTEKYPPSLQFLLMTLGPAFIFLSLIEGRDNIYTQVMSVFGKVPLFYYIIHLYVIHFLAMVFLIVRGEDWRQMILTADTFRTASLYHYGYDLSVVYLVWIGVVAVLYPLCRWYGQHAMPKRLK